MTAATPSTQRTTPADSQSSNSRAGSEQRLPKWYTSTWTLALSSSLALWLSLPPFGLWPLAWIAPLGWLLLVRHRQWPEDSFQRSKERGKKQERPKSRLKRIARFFTSRPYGRLYIAGLVFWLLTNYWLTLPHWATSFGWLALSAYLAVYIPLFVALSRVLVHRLCVSIILAAPIVWVGLELARSHILGGYGMANLIHTQFKWLALIQISDLAGAYLGSLLMMAVAACAARMLPCEQSRAAWWPIPIAVVMIASALAYGHSRLAAVPPTSATLKVALIQESFDTLFEDTAEDARDRTLETFDAYLRRSIETVIEHPDIDLLVWPESMFGVPPHYSYDKASIDPELAERIDEASEGFNSKVSAVSRAVRGKPLIVGVSAYHARSEEDFESFNSALYIDAAGKVRGRYDKMHAVMFGEYVPLGEYLPWLYELTPLSRGISEGDGPQLFEVDDWALSPSICYETTNPHLIRSHVAELADEGHEPDVLVNLTNDGWFWGSAELDLHLMCAVFRAVECRKPLVIAANTGISAWIDGNGRILARGPKQQAATIIAEVQRDGRESLYVKSGDWPAALCLLVCTLAAVIEIAARRRE